MKVNGDEGIYPQRFHSTTTHQSPDLQDLLVRECHGKEFFLNRRATVEALLADPLKVAVKFRCKRVFQVLFVGDLVLGGDLGPLETAAVGQHVDNTTLVRACREVTQGSHRGHRVTRGRIGSHGVA